jgi:hypothetical protein
VWAQACEFNVKEREGKQAVFVFWEIDRWSRYWFATIGLIVGIEGLDLHLKQIWRK